MASELQPFASSKTFNLRAVWGGLLGRCLDEYMPKHGEIWLILASYVCMTLELIIFIHVWACTHPSAAQTFSGEFFGKSRAKKSDFFPYRADLRVRVQKKQMREIFLLLLFVGAYLPKYTISLWYTYSHKQYILKSVGSTYDIPRMKGCMHQWHRKRELFCVLPQLGWSAESKEMQVVSDGCSDS